MENLETIKLSKQQELARYRQLPDAKPYVIKKLTEQIVALEHCVDLADSRVDNQLLILLRDTLYKALYVEDRADVLIVGMRLTDRSNRSIWRIWCTLLNSAIRNPDFMSCSILVAASLQIGRLPRCHFIILSKG